MESLKKGQVIYIQSFKHDGSLHRTWSSATVLDVDQEKVVVITYKTWVIESNGRKWFTREPAICYYYFHRWYNIIAMVRSRGIFYYCNLATPSIFDGESLKNIDYDLDVKLFPNNHVIVLDENEFEQHKVEMEYSEALSQLVEDEKDRLVEAATQRKGPFKEADVLRYYEEYLNINEF